MGEMTLIGAYVTLSFHAMGVPFLLSLLFSLIIGFILEFSPSGILPRPVDR